MVRALLVSVCLSALATVGCTVTTSNPFRDDCDTVVQDYCNRAVNSCGFYSFSVCVSDADAMLSCGTVTGDSASLLNTCDYDINSYGCSGLFDANGNVYPPASCFSAFY